MRNSGFMDAKCSTHLLFQNNCSVTEMLRSNLIQDSLNCNLTLLLSKLLIRWHGDSYSVLVTCETVISLSIRPCI